MQSLLLLQLEEGEERDQLSGARVVVDCSSATLETVQVDADDGDDVVAVGNVMFKPSLEVVSTVARAMLTEVKVMVIGG